MNSISPRERLINMFYLYKNCFMKKVFAVLFLLLVLFGIWFLFFKKSSHESQPKQEALKVGAHSTEFNKSITDAIYSYTALKDAFVDADTLKVKAQDKKFM